MNKKWAATYKKWTARSLSKQAKIHKKSPYCGLKNARIRAVFEEKSNRRAVL
jgi:hypothetical protein